jgi:hypothetical protein
MYMSANRFAECGFNPLLHIWIAKQVDRWLNMCMRSSCALISNIISLPNASLISRSEHRLADALDRGSEGKMSRPLISFDQVKRRRLFRCAVLDRNNIRPICLCITVFRTNPELVFPTILGPCVPAVGVDILCGPRAGAHE